MEPSTIFMIIWMLVLPILAILFMIFAPIFWFLIVPKIARTLTWSRFRKVSFHFISDDSGYSYLVPAKTVIPEGVVQTKNFGYRLLPRPTIKHGKEHEETVKKMLTRKFIWADMGKPIWFDYAGKVGSFNPATLAIIEQSKSKKPLGNPAGVLAEIKKYIKGLPKTLALHDRTLELRRDLQEFLEKLELQTKIQELTIIDPTIVKSLLPGMYTPSQLKALAINRELYGMERRGKEYTKLIIGGAVIIALLVLGILAIATLGR